MDYIYTSYKESPKVIFTCTATDILEADKKLLEATGIVAKEAFISVWSPQWGSG